MTESDTKHFGELLKQRRDELHMTLKEAENATSIRIGYLQAIEEGEMGKLISPVYAQGFIRQYSAFLGLDAEKMITDHPELFNRFDKQEFSYGIGTLEMRNTPGASGKWTQNILWVIVFGLVLFAAWIFARFIEVI